MSEKTRERPDVREEGDGKKGEGKNERRGRGGERSIVHGYDLLWGDNVDRSVLLSQTCFIG